MVGDVVPAEEVLAEGAGVLDRTESVGEGGAVLEGRELALAVWVVVADVRAGVRLGDAEVGQELGDLLGGHRGTAVGVDGQLVTGDVLLGDGLVQQPLGKCCGLSFGDHPADRVAARRCRGSQTGSSRSIWLGRAVW